MPAIFLWILAPLETYLTLRITEDDKFNANVSGVRERRIPFNRYNVARFITVALIIGVNAIQFGNDLYYYLVPDQTHWITMADLTSSVLNIFTFVSFGRESFDSVSRFMIFLSLIFSVYLPF